MHGRPNGGPTIIRRCTSGWGRSLSARFLRLVRHNSASRRLIADCTLSMLVVRMMLVHENRRLDAAEWGVMKGPQRARIEEAARIEGITFEEAVERKKGFRYLY